MINYTVSTILTSSTSSVSVHNDGFMDYNKRMNDYTIVIFYSKIEVLFSSCFICIVRYRFCAKNKY
jgi:hypothetical protein